MESPFEFFYGVGSVEKVGGGSKQAMTSLDLIACT